MPDLIDFEMVYRLPYRLSQKGSRALVVGSGLGNDVAAALRNGMGQIDAVEIDPTIIELGITCHPENPYSDKRLTIINDDARSFFKKSSDYYDVVAFGLLDSHALLSGWSSVRLDSFVYTIESIYEVKEHFAKNGKVSLTFAESTKWIEERLGRMMADVFGQGNVWIYRSVLGTNFIASGVQPDRIEGIDIKAWKPASNYHQLSLTYDDWPYLYMQARQIPKVYWQSLLLILIVTLIY